MKLKSISSWFSTLIRQQSKRKLLTVMFFYLAILVATISIYGFFYIQNLQKNTYHQKQSELQSSILSLSLIAEQECQNSIPNYHKLNVYANTLPNMKQVWIANSKEDILFYLSEPKPTKLYTAFNSSVKLIATGVIGAIYSRVDSYYLFSVPLSNGDNLFLALSEDSLAVPPYYSIYFVTTGILIAISIFVFYFFRKHVYLPISTIEKAINIVAEEEIDFKLDIPENNELYPLSKSINTMIEKMREVLNREYIANILRKQSEINALQSQINPHFLFNTLDSIRGQATMQGSFEIANLLKSLSNIFRYSISKTANLMTLDDELKHMDNYLIIQQYRFNNKFVVTKHFDGDEADLLSCKIPKLTIQPIVENAVFHGLETKKGKGCITIHVYSTEKRLIIEIEEDGVGIDSEKLNKLNESLLSAIDFAGSFNDGEGHKSIALNNVNQRIKLLYGDDYGLKVFSTIGIGTMVQITIPIIRKT